MVHCFRYRFFPSDFTPILPIYPGKGKPGLDDAIHRNIRPWRKLEPGIDTVPNSVPVSGYGPATVALLAASISINLQ